MHKTQDSRARQLGPWRSVDLQLLELFDRIHRYRNVSSACAELGLSQPAASRGIGRLRHLYGDALFVRQQRGVLPTPLADWLAPQIGAALTALRGTVEPPAFDPKTAKRVFVVAMSDIGERYFLPRLVQRLAIDAPCVTLEAVGPATSELGSGLASGAIDLVAGFLPAMGKQVHVQRLFRERFVYIARKGHPALNAPLTAAKLRTLPHALASPVGTGHALAVERVLTSARVRAPIALRVRSFLSVGPIVADTDLIAAVPSNLARLVAGPLRLQLVPPVIQIPGFDVEMAWHQRYHHDRANQWLRGLFTTLFRQ